MCLELGYDTDKIQLKYKVDLNEKSVYDSIVSLDRIPPICFIPFGFDNFANVCLIMENVVLTKENRRVTGSFKLKSTLLTKVYTKEIGTFSLGL
mgnify:CR=1 FL=1